MVPHTAAHESGISKDSFSFLCLDRMSIPFGHTKPILQLHNNPNALTDLIGTPFIWGVISWILFLNYSLTQLTMLHMCRLIILPFPVSPEAQCYIKMSPHRCLPMWMHAKSEKLFLLYFSCV